MAIVFRVCALVLALAGTAVLGALLSRTEHAGAFATITSPDTDGSVGIHSSITIDGVGNPVISYFRVTDSSLRVLHCGNATCSSGNSIVTADSDGFVGVWTSIALDATGNPVVSHAAGGPYNQIRVLHCADPDCSSGNSIADVGAIDESGTAGTSLVLDGLGNPVVAYADEPGLKLVRCGDPDCAAGNTTILADTVLSVGGPVTLALDALGYPVVGYASATEYGLDWDLTVLHCGNAYCTAGNTITKPDTVGVVGRYPSLALNAMGNPVISYLDETNRDLKVLQCGDPTCAAGNTIATPDTAVGSQLYSSLELDMSGNPVVSYYDQADFRHDLKMLRCGNPTCTTGNLISSPDQEGTTGGWTSLALDATGNAAVSYFDYTNDDLKVLRCDDTACSLPPTATATPTITSTPVPTSTPVVAAAAIHKAPQGKAGNVVAGDPPLANLFLCEDLDQSDDPDGLCDGDNEGALIFIEHAFSPTPLGAFEFQIKFDHKIFDIDLECVTEADPDPACNALDAQTWDIALANDLLNDPFRTWDIEQCFRNVTENYINFACTSTGPPDAGLTGEIDLAYVRLRPDADLKFRLSPGNDNGVVRVILDENCELVDPLGHPVEGSIAGGLTQTCGDLAVTVRILEGDLDLDCDVDLSDAQAIAQRYGMVLGLFLYDPWYDLEPNIKDFDVDAKDVQKVFGRLGSTCQAPIPPQPPVAPPQA